MQPLFTTISQDKLKIDNTSFHLGLSESLPTKLRENLDRFGILHPLLVQPLTGDSYLVLNGHRRYRWLCTNSDITDVPVHIMAGNLSNTERLSRLLADQMIGGPLTVMEQCNFLRICKDSLSDQEIRKHFFAPLGLKGGDELIAKRLTLLELESSILQSLHRGVLSEKTSQELRPLSSVARLQLHAIFTKFQLGNSKQKRLLFLCKDLAGRRGVALETILAEPDINSILTHSEMNNPQKMHRLFDYLQLQCFPRSEEMERHFKKRVQSMDLPSTCHLEHSPAFEKNSVALHIRFENVEKCEEALKTIKGSLKEN